MKKMSVKLLIAWLIVALSLPLHGEVTAIKKDEPNKLLLAAGIILGAVCLGFIIKAIHREATKTDPERAQELNQELNRRTGRYQEYIELLHDIQQIQDLRQQKESKKIFIARATRQYSAMEFPILAFEADLTDNISWTERSSRWIAPHQHAVPHGVALNNSIQNFGNDLVNLRDILLTARPYEKERSAKRKAVRRQRELHEKRELKQKSYEPYAV